MGEEEDVFGGGGRSKLPMREWVDDLPPLPPGYEEDDDSDWNPVQVSSEDTVRYCCMVTGCE